MGQRFIVLELEEVHPDGRIRHTRRVAKSAGRGRPAGGYAKVHGPTTKASCEKYVRAMGGAGPVVTPYEEWSAEAAA